ncbi:MAG: PfkB family carbohydrate kinase [Anaerolineales bacterium]
MQSSPYPPLDYLVIGHLACDLTPHGNQLGGTVAYAALTAHALGKRTGIITAWGDEGLLTPIEHLPRAGIHVPQSTTFENVYTPTGRIQTLHHHAPRLTPYVIPHPWHTTPLVHFGPIVHEIDPALLNAFPKAFIGLTPQGWLRQWDENGHVSTAPWPLAAEILPKAHATVLSLEDLGGDEDQMVEMAHLCGILVVTEGIRGARMFIEGIPTHIPTIPTPEVDATGAGDIFAAAFFIHLHQTNDPFQAAHFATELAAQSVTRPGLQGIPHMKSHPSKLLTP